MVSTNSAYAGKGKRKSRKFLLPDADAFPKMTGCELYFYRPSVTGLNWYPVEEHLAFIMGGASTDEQEPPGVTLKDVGLRVVRDGFLLWYDGATELQGHDEDNDLFTAALPVAVDEDEDVDEEIEEAMELLPVGQVGAFIEGIIKAYPTGAIQALPDGSRRVWRQYPSEWLITMLRKEQSGWVQVPEETFTVPLDAVKLWAFDEGLVTPAQDTYWDIESIWSSLRRQRTRAALSKVFIGYVGEDEDQFHEVMDGERDYLNFPTGVQVVEMGNTAVTTQLLAQDERLFPLYMRQVHLIIGSDSSNESGVAKRIKLFPELTYQERKRDQIEEVCEAFGFTVNWKKLELFDTQESIQRHELYRGIHDDGAMTDEENLELVRDLVGLPYDPALLSVMQEKEAASTEAAQVQANTQEEAKMAKAGLTTAIPKAET